MEYRIFVFHGVVAGVIAKGSFNPFFAGDHVSFKHDFRLGRHQQVRSLGFYQVYAVFPDKSGHGHLVHIRRQRRRAGPDRGGVATQRHRHVHPGYPLFLIHPVMAGAYFVRLPMHPGGLAVENLHPVSAVVLYPSLRVPADHQGKGDVSPAIHGPALDDGKLKKVNVAVLEHHFLAGSTTDSLRLERA